MQACGLSERIAGADLMLTGEGQLDSQTVSGKTISGVAKAARTAGVPVVALAGSVVDAGQAVAALGLAGAYAITPAGMKLEEAMARAAELLEAATERVCRKWARK